MSSQHQPTTPSQREPVTTPTAPATVVEDIEDSEEAGLVKGSSSHSHSSDKLPKQQRDKPLQSASDSNLLAHTVSSQARAVGKSVAPSASIDHQVCYFVCRY